MAEQNLKMQKAAWAETMLNFDRPQELGLYLKAERQRLIGRVEPGFDGLDWCEWATALMDAAVERLFDIACQLARKELKEYTDCAPEIAVVATGGYGRGELSPHSDLDLTFIPQRDGDPFLDSIVRHMFHGLMDAVMTRAGVTVGYAYRLIEDCGQLDPKTRTGLVDMRSIAGSQTQFNRFGQNFWALFNQTDFLFEKRDEYKFRHEKLNNTPFLAEPNLKEGVGALRDYHVARWMAYTRYNAPIYQAWSVLREQGAIGADDIARAHAAFTFLTRVRNHLHAQIGEERDVLVRTRQEAVAEAMGYRPGQLSSPAEPFMRDLYEHSAALHRICRQVVEHVADSRLFLSVGLDSERGELVPAKLFLEKEPPLWTLWACRFAQRYALKLGVHGRESLRASLDQPALNPPPPEAGHLLLEILGTVGSVEPTLRMMAENGVLRWLAPEVDQVLALIPYDSSHEYSVGEHTLRVMGFVDRLLRADAPELAELRSVLQGLVRPQALYLAILFHDIGKIDPHRPHSEVGAEMLEAFAERLELDPETAADAAWLVRKHLLMAETARQRDLTLDRTIKEFVRQIEDEERLRMLYLLTYADTNAVGTRIWTPVQAHFVRELFARASVALAGGDDTPPDLGGYRRRLLKQLTPESTSEEAVAEHIHAMPPHYLLNTPREQMSLHIAFVERAKAGSPVIDYFHPVGSAHSEMTIVTLDDPEPGLLSKIAGALWAADVDVHSASVFTREGDQPVAIDTLWVDYKGRQLTATKAAEVQRLTEQVLKGEASVEELLLKRNKSAELPHPAYRVRIHRSEGDDLTVVDIQTQADKGVLYRLSHALSQLRWDIHSARLGLWAGRAVVSFYVTKAGGSITEADEARLHELIPLAERGATVFGR